MESPLDEGKSMGLDLYTRVIEPDKDHESLEQEADDNGEDEFQIGDTLLAGRDPPRVKASSQALLLWEKANKRGDEHGPDDWKQVSGKVTFTILD